MTPSPALDPHKQKIDALVDQFPELSAVRVWEEIRKGPETIVIRGDSYRMKDNNQDEE